MDVLVKTKARGKIPVRIMNVTTRAVKLRKQETVGKFLQAKEETGEETSSERSKQTGVTANMSQKDFGNLFDWTKMGKDKKKVISAALQMSTCFRGK